MNNHDLFVFQGLANVKHIFIFVALCIMSMLVVLVLKNAAECTSQRLKRTSGARFMIRNRNRDGNRDRNRNRNVVSINVWLICSHTTPPCESLV